MNDSQRALLIDLFTELLAVTPRGSLPYVTLTTDPVRPLGALVVGPCGHVVCQGTGKTVAGLVNLISLRLPVGHGEAQQ